ncbi:MAG: flavodoxin family protein [Candidatus Brocadiae bacterium]|nr:flavodoxin family protein [Candidatus Brocadiia bacterium]
MEVLVFAASPNKDGLTEECAQAAVEGAGVAGANAQIIYLNDKDIGLCQACDRGWGKCRKEHSCQVEDGFQAVHEKTGNADGYVVVTPVYFGQLSESAKAYFDRLRRCEATRGDESALAGKPVIGVAAAGGSGGGITSCLEEMSRLFSHLRCSIADMITVTQKSRSYKPAAIRQATQAMVAALGKE